MIVVFFVKGCYKCEQLKEKLKSKGVEFEEKNGMNNIDYLRKLNPNLRSYPVLVVDDKYIEDWEAYADNL